MCVRSEAVMSANMRSLSFITGESRIFFSKVLSVCVCVYGVRAGFKVCMCMYSRHGVCYFTRCVSNIPMKR